MKKYIKPSSAVIEMEVEGSMLAASGNHFSVEDREAKRDALNNKQRGIFPGLWEDDNE